MTKEQLRAWYSQIEDDLKKNRIVNVERGFDWLLREKSFGGLDYAIFFEGAKKSYEEQYAESNKRIRELTEEKR